MATAALLYVATSASGADTVSASANDANTAPIDLSGTRVLLVHSYWHDFTQVNDITQGVRAAFEGSNAELKVFYMDTKRRSNPEWLTESGRLAKDKVEEFKPHVVIAADDNAQEYFAKDYANLKGAPYFVFCGVNAEPEIYGYPAKNITGVLERDLVLQSIDLLLKLKPDVKKVAVLGDDGPTTGIVNAYIRSLDLPVEITQIHAVSCFSEWKALMATLQNKVDALILNSYRAVRLECGGVQSMEPGELMRWTVRNNSLPSVCFNAPSIDDGVLCGISGSFVEHGFAAARIARDILQGLTPEQIPVTVNQKGVIMLNLKTAATLGIEIPYSIIRVANKVIR